MYFHIEVIVAFMRFLLLTLVASSLLPVSNAQAQWTVTVTPATTIPIGSCGAVRLDIKDSKREVPRNPEGNRVSMAEFDMVVSGGSVAAQYQDAYHVLACACQGAAVGSTGLVTATYPATVLPLSMRVPGVSAKGSGSFVIGRADNKINPPGCVTPSVAPRLAGVPTTSPTAPTTTKTPIALAPTQTPVRTPVPIATTPATSPPAPAPTTATTPVTSVPIATAPVAPTPINTSPAPTAPSPTSSPLPAPTGSPIAGAPISSGIASGTNVPVAIAPQQLKNPSGFTAKHVGDGNVLLEWQPVAGAISYRLDGPGFPSTGKSVTIARGAIYPNMPAGANSWKLTALYAGNKADYANPSIATAVVRILPPHTVPWLSKNNGVGSPATVQTPSFMKAFSVNDSWFVDECLTTDFQPGRLDTLYSAGSGRWLGSLNYRCPRNSGGMTFGIQSWVNIPGLPLWGEPSQFADEAIYGNAIDLGVGRRAQCAQAPMTVPPYGITTTCYATAHGIVPGEPGFNDFNTITRPGEGTGEDFILAMVISKDPRGSTFLVLLRDSVTRNNQRFPFYGRLTDQVTLDTEGPKYLPHVCLSCHGGKYNKTTRRVDGASFLPLDPDLLAFSSPEELAGQQEKIRKINSMIAASDPTSAVAAYIRGLYGNSVSVPGTLAKADFVPQGWSAQSGFYRTLVKPYCATCHLAAPASWNFASWDNFKENAALIKAAVCSAHTMPHGELQYKAFWTKDTGPVYLPGLLATTLDEYWPKAPGALPSCP